MGTGLLGGLGGGGFGGIPGFSDTKVQNISTPIVLGGSTFNTSSEGSSGFPTGLVALFAGVIVLVLIIKGLFK